jgi:sugar lactone lactonase YvrE
VKNEPKILIDGLMFAEGPRWHEGRLWFSDMHAKEVVAVDLDGRRETVVHVPNQPSGLGWLPDGRLLVVSMTDRKLLRLDPEGLVEVADLSDVAEFHCNDMVVDREGRAYVGNFGFDNAAGETPKPTRLAIVDPDGTVRAGGQDLLFPNGMVITPDGKTLIVAETYGLRLTAFDIGADGGLANQRLFAQLEVVPDGICLDAEGCIWAANPRRPGGFVRVAEGGKIVEQIDLSDRGGYACMLGGPERRTLFLLEAFESRPQDIKPGQSRIRMVDVDVPGVGLP